MYNTRPNLLIGFHGCDETVSNKLLNDPNDIKISTKPYDWLGHGFYVWENNYDRALEWAEEKKRRDTKMKKPSVIGVVFTLGNCFDLTDSSSIELLPLYYDLFIDKFKKSGQELPKNKNVEKDKHKDLLFRELDCAVFEYMHKSIKEEIESNSSNTKLKEFDTVKGVFLEGAPVYEGAGIYKKTHVQICVRNLDCIKGFFKPRL